jgi:hypothetical protein
VQQGYNTLCHVNALASNTSVNNMTANAMEQLWSHVVSPAMREHAIMYEIFSVWAMPEPYKGSSSLVESVRSCSCEK